MLKSNHTILLVEDNEDDVFLMKRALKSAKIVNPVYVAEDGQQAIDYLSGVGIFSDRGKYPYPEIMFLDLKMPRRSGFDVLDWMDTRADLKRPLVVLLSSSNSPQDMERSTRSGAIYAIKPPTNELFERLTGDFGIRWLTA